MPDDQPKPEKPAEHAADDADGPLPEGKPDAEPPKRVRIWPMVLIAAAVLLGSFGYVTYTGEHRPAKRRISYLPSDNSPKTQGFMPADNVWAPIPDNVGGTPKPPPVPDDNAVPADALERLYEIVDGSLVLVRAKAGLSVHETIGVTVSQQYVALTREHVVAAARPEVLYKGRAYAAAIAFDDPAHGICALHVPGLPAETSHPTPNFPPRPGQPVFALWADENRAWKAAEGYVSTEYLDPGADLAFRARIDPEKSGGVLFDTYGYLVGLVRRIPTDNEARAVTIEHVLALPDYPVSPEYAQPAKPPGR